MTFTLTAFALIGLHLGGITPRNILSTPTPIAQAATYKFKPLPPSDRQGIQRCFVAYKQALLAKQGDLAVEQVSATTLAYYSKMRDLALRGDGATVRSQSLSDQYTVLALRQGVGLKKRLLMTNKELISLSIEEGWFGESRLRDLSIGNITVKGDRAEAVFVVKGKTDPAFPSFVFLKEQKEWKIDITALLPVVEQSFQQWYAVAKALDNLSTDTFLTHMLELISGKPVSPEIWQPLVR
jgi:hypothetical protein